MCTHGTHKTLTLTTCSEVSHTGEDYRREWPVDACIADIVKALDDAGIHMLGSCCGHGQRDGSIILRDGRTLRVS